MSKKPKILSVPDYIRANPECVHPEDHARMVLGKTKSPSEIANMTASVHDRIWILTHDRVLPGVVLREFECRCMEAVLPTWEDAYPNDRSIRHAIDTRRRWIYETGSAIDLLDARRNAAHVAHATHHPVARLVVYATGESVDAYAISAWALSLMPDAQSGRETQLQILRDLIAEHKL